MITHALLLIKHGFRIFPVGQDKIPLIKDWPKLASTDPKTVSDWWTKYPAANIGIATGAESGIVVLDVDSAAGGYETLAELERANGTLPATVCAKTGGGGRHLYFAHPGGEIRNSARRVGPGIDVRGDGGYVVAPPSMHSSGVPYAWITSPDRGGLAPLPAWLMARMSKRAAPVELTHDGDFPAADPALLEQGRRMLAAHGPAIQGRGGNQHTFEVGAILLNDFALTELEAWPLVQEWNATCQPPWDSAELMTCLRNGARYASGEYGEHRLNPLVVEWIPDGEIELTNAPEPADTGDERGTDVGNAKLFVKLLGDSWRFVAETGIWLQWGTHWRPDTVGEVEQEALKVVAHIRSQEDPLKNRIRILTGQRGGPDDAKIAEQIEILETVLKATKHRADALESDGGLTRMLRRAQPMLAVSATTLDRQHLRINLPQGTWDVAAGRLVPHRREDLATRCIEVAYDPGAKCPAWDRFIAEFTCGDQDLADYLQRAAGYSMTGDTREQILFFLYGKPGSGKGTFTSILARLLGGYARGAPASLIEDIEGKHPAEVAVLEGARMAMLPELKKRKAFPTALINRLTSSGEAIATRGMGENFHDFIPTHKLWMQGNFQPKIGGDKTDGIWRRLKVIPCMHTAETVDLELGDRLVAELPGILNWALGGCTAWVARPLKKFEPAAVKQAVADYYTAEADVLGEFFAWLTSPETVLEGAAVHTHVPTCVGCSAKMQISGSKLHEIYVRWCHDHGERSPLCPKDFGAAVTAAGVLRFSKRKFGNYWSW